MSPLSCNPDFSALCKCVHHLVWHLGRSWVAQGLGWILIAEDPETVDFALEMNHLWGGGRVGSGGCACQWLLFMLSPGTKFYTV
jgi:hypothetical protein